MDLIVSPAVLIPRPETEHVIEKVLELSAQDRGAGSPASPETNFDLGKRASSPVRSTRIIDVRAGSGCIALPLARVLPHTEIHVTDIAAAAMEVARATGVLPQRDHPVRV